MKTIKTRKATGTLGQMTSEVNPVQLAKMRNRMLIAAKIADAMQAQHLNQKQFAKLMGRTESEISDWLSGDRNFTIDTLFDIGQALGITFLSTTLHYTTSDTYEFEPMMANEPLEKPTPYNRMTAPRLWDDTVICHICHFCHHPRVRTAENK